MRSVGTGRGRPRQALALVAAALSALAVLAPGGAVAAPSQQTTASISGQADWIANFRITVYVTVQGFGGQGFLNVNVTQATPFGPQNGFGNSPILCDGTRNVYPVGILGGPNWQLGDAVATAQAFCPSPFPAGSDSRTIRISKP